MKKHFAVWAFLGVLACLGDGSILQAGEKYSISLEAPPQAQILKIDYYLKVLKEFAGGKPALHFEVKIKNLSEKAERYSVMVSTPDGTSASGFVPAKAKKAGALPLLDPKEEGKITIPLLTENLPSIFSVEVEPAPPE